MTQGYIGFADAYIDGDFSVDDNSLETFLLVVLVNKHVSNLDQQNKRGWWSLLTFTTSISSAKLFILQILRQNSLTQARKNISRHYDLSNEFFESILGETMVYSCGIFKTNNEDLKTAQLRKITSLIEKAKIEKTHEVLEIGCGWGTFAIEVVKRTGCKYTGITLSKEQAKYIETKVKEVGLQDNIKILLCDYRELRETHKYNRIIACEMIEHVGHKYMEQFFGCCESLLAEDGLFVLQFISVPDHRYEEHRKRPGFLREYLFHGLCLPSLSRIMSAMANASKLRVEHVEDISSHFYSTISHWRENLQENESKLLQMGYEKKIIRTWEYCFDYFAVGFKLGTRGEYQIVFSRPSNRLVSAEPSKGFPSAYQFS